MLGLCLSALLATASQGDNSAAFEIVCADGAVRLTGADLVRYDWPAQTFWLSPADHARLFAAEPPMCSVLAGGVLVYAAHIVSPFISSSRDAIVLTYHELPMSGGPLPVEIRLGYPTAAYYSGVDLRSDPRLREALRAAGKLDEAPRER